VTDGTNSVSFDACKGMLDRISACYFLKKENSAGIQNVCLINE